VRVVADNVAQVCAGGDLIVDCFDNRAGREVLSAHARAAALPLVHAALSGDGTFGLVRWDEHFTADAEDQAGQATCEGGEHLPFIGLLAAALARSIQDFVAQGIRREAIVSLSALNTIAR
jgi:molybdopterin-synthase adenylyltransferase